MLGNEHDTQRTREWRKASGSSEWTVHNDEGATACGDVGHGYSTRGRLWRVWHRRGRQDARERSGRNPMNLMVGCRMQQAYARSGGGTRQGGESPRRRNVCDEWHRHAEAHRLRSAGVDTSSDVDGEAVFEEPCRSSSVRNHRAERREMRLRERKKEGYVGLHLLRKRQCSHHDGTSGGVETHDAAMARAWGRPTTQASDD